MGQGFQQRLLSMERKGSNGKQDFTSVQAKAGAGFALDLMSLVGETPIVGGIPKTVISTLGGIGGLTIELVEQYIQGGEVYQGLVGTSFTVITLDETVSAAR